jgi:2-isopropylmalate synthase
VHRHLSGAHTPRPRCQSLGLRSPRALAIELSRDVQARTDASGDDYSAEATLSLFRSLYLNVAGTLVLDGAGVARHSQAPAATWRRTYATPARCVSCRPPAQARSKRSSNCSASACPRSWKICDYSEHATSEGASARAIAYVALRAGDQMRYGVGEHEDVVVASLRAIVSAYNRLRS